MNKTKILLAIASLLVVIGVALFLGTMFSVNWDFSKITTFKFETNTYEITDTYRNISFSTIEANVELVPSQDGQTKVVCYEKAKVKHAVEVKDNVLTISVVDQRQWYDYSGISFVSQKVTVYLPFNDFENATIKSDTGNVKIPSDFSFNVLDVSLHTGNVVSEAQVSTIKIKTSTGNVSVKNLSNADCTVSSSTGNVHLKDVKASTLSINSSTGNVDLNNVVVANKMTVTLSTGNAYLEKCDAGEIYIKTSTGNVRGSLLSEKNFIANSSTGSVSVPTSNSSAPRCEIKTSTGNIQITIAE